MSEEFLEHTCPELIGLLGYLEGLVEKLKGRTDYQDLFVCCLRFTLYFRHRKNTESIHVLS